MEGDGSARMRERHTELVSGSISPLTKPVRIAGSMLKQVEHDEITENS